VDRQEKTRQLVQELLCSQRFAALSTDAETGPYASLIAFWAGDDLSRIVFATMRATRKFNYLVKRPEVALLFDNRSNRDIDVSEAMAVTATGSARELADETTRAAAAGEYLAKHPHLASFVNSPGCALVQVDVDVYYVVTHFQSVVELHMQAGDGGG
jgi:nitroimidazol reductase NimA-like FMN-containing flavoprotein (pyridoxamine 5'-phosphate oxidase superfamily)